MGCIYKITNIKNGKVYVGLTVNTAEKRFKKHISMVYSDGCSALYGAIKKYGKDSFTIETIVKSDCKDTLMELESFYIKKLNTISPNGYNLTSGGENCKVTQLTKDKISSKLKGRNVTWGGKVSVSVKKLWENKEYREQQTKQRHEKRGKYKDGIIKPLRIDLPIDEINKLYSEGLSIPKIAKKYGVVYSTIKKRLKDV